MEREREKETERRVERERIAVVGETRGQNGNDLKKKVEKKRHWEKEEG